MKKLYALLTAAALMAAPHLNAQQIEDFGYFDHLGAGISLGVIDGIGVDVAAPIGNYVQMRAGVSFVPKITPSITSLEEGFDYEYGKRDPVTGKRPENTLTAEVSAGWVNGKMLFDVYPFRKVPFRITAGFYVGTSALIRAKNTSPVKLQGEGFLLGNTDEAKALFPDENENIKIEARVNTFKPYVGIGYGYAVPKSRVNVGFDLGVMCWGKPKGYLWARDADKPGQGAEWIHVSRDLYDEALIELDDNETDRGITDGLDIAEKFKVGPVLNVRVGFRIF